jgi:hypothetical protein
LGEPTGGANSIWPAPSTRKTPPGGTPSSTRSSRRTGSSTRSPPSVGCLPVLRYLGRYTHRVAITNLDPRRTRPPASHPLCAAAAHISERPNRLTRPPWNLARSSVAGRHRHVFDDHALLTTFALQFRHGLELLDEEAHQAPPSTALRSTPRTVAPSAVRRLAPGARTLTSPVTADCPYCLEDRLVEFEPVTLRYVCMVCAKTWPAPDNLTDNRTLRRGQKWWTLVELNSLKY